MGDSLFQRKQEWHRALVKAGARDVDKLLGRAVTDYMLRDLEAYPGRAALSLDTGLHPSTVTAALGRLEEAGVVTVDRSARAAGGRQGAPVVALVWPFDEARAAQVLSARAAWVDRRAGSGTPGAESPYRDPGTQSRGTASPESSGSVSRVAVPRRQSRGTATPREGREEDKRREEKPTPLPSSMTRTKRPNETTAGLGGWTGHDVRRLAPPCAHGHGPLALAWNRGEGSWFAFCRAEGCRERFDPRKAQRAVAPTDDQEEERERRLRERPRPAYAYPGPAPAGDVVDQINQQILARRVGT